MNEPENFKTEIKTATDDQLKAVKNVLVRLIDREDVFNQSDFHNIFTAHNIVLDEMIKRNMIIE